MQLSQVASELDDAIGYAEHLEDSPLKTDILTTLTRARADLSKFSVAIIAKLDRISEGVDKL